MTIFLHTTRTSAPNAAAATSVSPLDPSGSSKTKFSKNRKDIYQTVTDNIMQRWKPVLNPGPARGSVYPACLVCHPITPPVWLIVA